MLEQLLTQGDSQFQQGNFSEACDLYGQALSSIENNGGDQKQLAAVMQKLADSQYASNLFSEARTQYERLVKLQQETGASAREKVLLLQKLARSSDKCDLQDDAQKYFTAAYELGKATLPPTNFLNRSVMDSYAEWLRTTGRNESLLNELEAALGIEKSSAAPAAPEPEVTADTVKVAGASSGIAREQEQFVVKKRLTKLRKQKASEAAAEAEEAAKKKLEASDKTLEQQVAERKFLRKSEDKATDTTKSRRSKLRSAMSEEIKKPAGAEAEVQDFSSPGQDLRTQARTSKSRPTASGSFAALDAPDDERADVLVPESTYDPAMKRMIADIDALPENEPQPLYNAQLNMELDPSVAKLIAKKPRRHFSDRLEASRDKKDVETKVMSEQSRSFLQHAEQVKKAADPNSELAPDVVQMKEQEKGIETPRGVQVARLLKFAAPVVAVALLGIAITMLLKQSTAPRTIALPSFASNLIDKPFTTSDDVITVQPGKAEISVSGALRRTAKVHYWSGDLNDEIEMLHGTFKNSKWLFPCKEGLKDSKGIILYAKDSPERKLVAVMKDVADQANQYYVVNNDYPSYSTNLTKPAYTNPFTKASEDVAVFSGVDNRAEGAINSKLDIVLRTGKLYNSETALHPGAIHGLSVVGQPEFSNENNNYSFQTHCFYIRACDRDGKFLGSSSPADVFVLTLKNGQPVRVNSQDATSDYATRDICIAESAPPEASHIIGKYFGGIFFVVLILLLAMRSGTMTMSGRRRL